VQRAFGLLLHDEDMGRSGVRVGWEGEEERGVRAEAAERALELWEVVCPRLERAR
jgi:hypothetical protein